MISARKPVIAALVAALLFAVYLADRQRTSVENLAAIRLIDFDEMDAVSLVLHNENGDTELEKRPNGEWWITAPRELRADRDQVRAIIENIRGARKGSVFQADDLGDYGLASPDARVELRAVVGGERREIAIDFGDDAPQVGQVYACLAGTNEVFTVGDWVRGHARRGVGALRDHTLLSIKPDEVERIEVETARGSFVVQRTPDSSRWLIPEWKRPADQAFVSRVLTVLSTARALSIEDNPTTSTAKLGLEPPRLEVRLSGGGREEFLAIGSPMPGEDAFPVQSTMQPSLAIARAASLREVLQPLSAWGSKRFVWMPRGDIARVETRSGDSRMTLVRTGDDWIFASAPDMPVHPRKLEEFLQALEILQGGRLVAEDVTDPDDLVEYGFREEGYEALVTSVDGRVEGLRQGRTDTAEGLVYLLRVQDDSVWTVDFIEAQHYTRFRDGLADNRIHHGFADRTTRIVVRLPDGDRIVEKRNDVWRLETPGGASTILSAVAVRAFLTAVEELEWSSEIVGTVDAPVKARMEFLDADGEALHFVEELESSSQGYNLVRTPQGVYEAAAPAYRPVVDTLVVLFTTGK